jgi:hypothetical protein
MCVCTHINIKRIILTTDIIFKRIQLTIFLSNEAHSRLDLKCLLFVLNYRSIIHLPIFRLKSAYRALLASDVTLYNLWSNLQHELYIVYEEIITVVWLLIAVFTQTLLIILEQYTQLYGSFIVLHPLLLQIKGIFWRTPYFIYK